MKIRKYFGVMPLVGVVAMSGLFLAACGDEDNDASVEGDEGGEVPVGEGEGEGEPPVEAGEGEGEPPVEAGEGEGEPPVEAGEGEGEPPVEAGEGEGEGQPMDGGEGEGEGQPMDGGEGEGEGEVPATEKATLFCATYLTSCTGVQDVGHALPDWVDNGSCAAWYDAAAVGVDGADAGASQACYEYHLNAADTDGDRDADTPTASQNTHCGHAGGMAPCAD